MVGGLVASPAASQAQGPPNGSLGWLRGPGRTPSPSWGDGPPRPGRGDGDGRDEKDQQPLNAEPFGVGVISEVWAEPYHPDDDNPVFDFVACTPEPGVVAGASGFDLVVRHGLDEIDDADLVAVAARRDYRTEDPRISAALAAAHARGATIIASCTAAFQLGHAGLLDGRRCTTHWRYGAELAEAFPKALLDTDVLYVDDDRVVTGAGSAAGIDANLHLMRRWYGARVAAAAARRIVVPPHRDGGQAQFVRAPMPPVEAETLAPVLD